MVESGNTDPQQWVSQVVDLQDWQGPDACLRSPEDI